MRFSVLLPTRNGGALLENCIASILEQDYDDFELVVSDNANTDTTPEILAHLGGHPRLKVVRQGQVLPVADNWTAALQASSGEYILMMGDDDYLLPGALRRLHAAIERHGRPDCILYNALSYVAPSAISADPVSYWAQEHFHYGPDFSGEAVLSREHRLGIVFDMFRFRQRIPLNMQTTVFSRRAIERESGGRFQAPFPDHYLLNALLIAADTWVYLPERLVVVGLSPKSFGHYFYSQRSGAGLAYLGITTDFQGALPGSALLNGMCSWLLTLKEQYPRELQGVTIDRPGDVRRQAYSWLVQRRYGGITTTELASRLRRLPARDALRLLSTAFDAESWRRLVRFVRFGRKTQTEALWQGVTPVADVSNIREFSAWAIQHAVTR